MHVRHYKRRRSSVDVVVGTTAIQCKYLTPHRTDRGRLRIKVSKRGTGGTIGRGDQYGREVDVFAIWVKGIGFFLVPRAAMRQKHGKVAINQTVSRLSPYKITSRSFIVPKGTMAHTPAQLGLFDAITNQ